MPRPPHRDIRSSAIAQFIDAARVESLLAPWVPDRGERAFVVRCLLEEGPAHHRGANFVLLSLLGEVLARTPAPEKAAAKSAAADAGETIPVRMRLPPHLADEEGGDRDYPLGIAAKPLELLARKGSPELRAMVDALSDGPPQHALANAAMVTILGAILARLESAGS